MKLVRFTLIPAVLFFLPGMVAPALAQWEPDVRLTFNDSVSITSLNNVWAIAACEDTLHVVWCDTRDGKQEIYYKRSLDGGVSWGADTHLTQGSDSAKSPGVVVSGSNVHVVWEDYRDWPWEGEVYYKRSLDGGGSWSADTCLSRIGDYSRMPSVGIAGTDVHVVWSDFRYTNYEIFYKCSWDGGTSWGEDTRLTFDPNYSLVPSIAVTGSKVHLVWYDDRGGGPGIYYKGSTDRGVSWGADTCLTKSPAYYPSVAVSGSDVHAVWQDERNGSWQSEIYYKHSTNGGWTWGVDTRLTYDSTYSVNPSIAVSGSNVHVVWGDCGVTGCEEIYYIRSTDGGVSWSPETRLTYDSLYSVSPSVAVSGDKVHVVWWDERDGNSEIYYKRNPTGNSGVEESTSSSPISHIPFSIRSNPFTSFATVPGHETDRFTLYDISGRRVGDFKGDRIGEGLQAGVYFVRGEKGEARLVRVVKVR